MSSLFLLLAIAFAVISQIAAQIVPIKLTGGIVAAQLRCEGLYCPQWALDLSRYNAVEQINVTTTYQLQELLPLAPTAQRSFNLFTTYDATTRHMTVIGADYPSAGIDAYWVSKINNDVTSSSAVYNYVLVPHPDASTSNAGNMRATKIFSVAGGITFALFGDGSLHQVDLANQKYISLGGSILSDVKYSLTNAHVLDGTTLKSFILDTHGNSYLVKTDVSSNPVKVGTPLKVANIQGQVGTQTPVNAHMFTIPDGSSAPRLLVISHGNFDNIRFVDETTGESTSVINSMTSDEVSQPAELQCNSGSKDCDFWQTSAYDPVGNAVYFQAHYLENTNDDLDTTTSIYGLTFVKQAAGWFPYMTIGISPMTFGYEAYQFVNFA